MPICPKCHRLISENRYERHLHRCGTSHRHQAQSLYVPSATAQVESPERGITYESGRSHRTVHRRYRTRWILVVLAIALLIGSLATLYFLIG